MNSYEGLKEEVQGSRVHHSMPRKFYIKKRRAQRRCSLESRWFPYFPEVDRDKGMTLLSQIEKRGMSLVFMERTLPRIVLSYVLHQQPEDVASRLKMSVLRVRSVYSKLEKLEE